MLVSGMFVDEVILDTITGKNTPLDNPENVTSLELPTGLTVIVASKLISVIAPTYIAADLIFVNGNALTIPTVVAKSG